jgi:hypothetical protein
MSDTPESDNFRLTEKNGCITTFQGMQVVDVDFARYLERERNELRQVIRDVREAFPDLAEFEDKNGWSLKWLADKIEKAKGES